MKPILFNTEMVRAIQNGAKTATRRVVKPQPSMPYCHEFDGEWFWTSKDADDDMMDWWPSYETGLRPPYQPGDILYVRETWAAWSRTMGTSPALYYKADWNASDGIKWRPSIHMPREAARIFLRVTDVRVERLQEITPEQIDAEGCKEYGYSVETGELMPSSPCYFSIVWNNTIKKADYALYSWDVNPWVWVIEFERCERPGGST